MFWKKPNLPSHPEGCLLIPEHAAEPIVQAIQSFNSGNFSECKKWIHEGFRQDLPMDQLHILNDLQRRLRPEPAYMILATACVLTALFVALWAVSVSH